MPCAAASLRAARTSSTRCCRRTTSFQDLIAMSRSGDAIPVGYGSECRAGLERILQANLPDEGWGDDGPAAPADFDGLDFVPVPIDQFAADDEKPAEQEYRIVFRPKADLLKK